MKRNLMKTALSTLAAVALFVAAFSSAACSFWIIHQRECPATLIKKD